MQADEKVIYHREAQKKYKASLKGKLTEKKYATSLKGKKAKYKYAEKWRTEENNKFKKHIHYIVRCALKEGKIIKGICEVCGNKKTHAHHDDYYLPLEIRWLCASHHRKIKHKK